MSETNQDVPVEPAGVEHVAEEAPAAVELSPAEVAAIPVAEPAPPDDTARPWHGAENPLEALFQWVKAELSKR